MKRWAVMGALALVGCTAPVPQSLDARIAYGYALDASLRGAVATAVGNGMLSVAEAQKALADTDAIRAALDATRNAEASGAPPATLAGDLQIATDLLTSLQTFLTAKGVH